MLSNRSVSNIQTELYHYAKSGSCLILSLFLLLAHCLLAQNHLTKYFQSTGKDAELRVVVVGSRNGQKAMALPSLPKAAKQFYCNPQIL